MTYEASDRLEGWIDDQISDSDNESVDHSYEFSTDIDSNDDPLYSEAVEIVLDTKKTSISFIQRKLRIGYNRAANIIESMEAKGILSAQQSNGNREILNKDN